MIPYFAAMTFLPSPSLRDPRRVPRRPRPRLLRACATPDDDDVEAADPNAAEPWVAAPRRRRREQALLTPLYLLHVAWLPALRLPLPERCPPFAGEAENLVGAAVLLWVVAARRRLRPHRRLRRFSEASQELLPRGRLTLLSTWATLVLAFVASGSVASACERLLSQLSAAGVPMSVGTSRALQARERHRRALHA